MDSDLNRIRSELAHLDIPGLIKSGDLTGVRRINSLLDALHKFATLRTAYVSRESAG
jgi:hypothetical protein